MTERQAPASGPLWVWWKVAAIVTMVFGFTILIGLTVEAYRQAPPIPARAVATGGAVTFTKDDVVAGQQVFLKYGLMANGTIWGHGAYLGPDFSAQYLHNWALDAADHAAQARFRRAYGELTPEERGEIDGNVARTMKENRYDPSTDTLTLSTTDADSFKRQIAYWTDYFVTPANNGGLAAKLVADPEQLRELTAFFAWTAWASTAARPGTSHSYTNNFPYDPLAGNVLTGGPVIYSVLSLVFLLGGTAIVLLAFGKFAHLGWHSRARLAGSAWSRKPPPVSAGVAACAGLQARRLQDGAYRHVRHADRPSERNDDSRARVHRRQDHHSRHARLPAGRQG